MEHFAFNRDTIVSLKDTIVTRLAAAGKWIRTGVSGDSYWSVANGISHDGNVEGIFIIYFSVLENMLKVSPRLPKHEECSVREWFLHPSTLASRSVQYICMHCIWENTTLWCTWPGMASLPGTWKVLMHSLILLARATVLLLWHPSSPEISHLHAHSRRHSLLFWICELDTTPVPQGHPIPSSDSHCLYQSVVSPVNISAKLRSKVWYQPYFHYSYR